MKKQTCITFVFILSALLMITQYACKKKNNQIPDKPICKSPLDNSNNTFLKPDLYWTCIDQDSDSLFYDIFIGISQDPPKVTENYHSTIYSPGLLEANTTYYWKIIAYEVLNPENFSVSEIWSFTTTDDTIGIFTDPRDAQNYEVVVIGYQTWFAQNINYEIIDSWWYENIADTGIIYGRLYTYNSALNVCPDGWHLPTDAEWNTLEIELGLNENYVEIVGGRGDHATIMKSVNLWAHDYLTPSGNNNSGFNILPAGLRFHDGTFMPLNFGSGFWTNSEYSDTLAWSRGFSYNTEAVYREKRNKELGMAIRCLKNENH